jgi:hypothetical protein
MPQQVTNVVENNFTKGLITEATGLNFPENAATDTDNCIYTLVGDVTRRPGLNYEENYQYNIIPSGGLAYNTYKWDNAGGDGVTQVVVIQRGPFIDFYHSNYATVSSPLSTQLITSGNISVFTIVGVTFDITQECQFADGNGYLFIFHPSTDPLYCTFSGGIISIASIQLNIRDFQGVVDNLAPNARPSTLSNEHSYNLQNQGWTSGNTWSAGSTDPKSPNLGSNSWNVGTVTGISIGQIVRYHGTQSGLGGVYFVDGTGTVTSYSGGVLTLNVFVQTGNSPGGILLNSWFFFPISTGYIGTFVSAEGVYPSNADVWWYFKDSTGAFNPATTQPNVTLSAGNAPRGHFLLNAFTQNRVGVSGGQGLTTIQTLKRPTTGAWFQGRVWYAGVNDSYPASFDTPFYTWSTNIYFSQIVTSSNDFGSCYQVNDPTSENLFSILPTDGGVISIPQAGNIFKLFPIQNGLLVFAANGVWFITGSQGIGFSADDYTVVQLSQVKSISGTSFVNVQGLPYFWNEEGIYQVSPQAQGQLTVEPITVGTILTFYNSIPITSRRYARGIYDPIEYVITWLFKSTVETNIVDRYDFDRMLNYNVYNKAFYPYTISQANIQIPGIIYVSSPGGTNAPDPVVKFYTVVTNNSATFSELNDDVNWVDFFSFDHKGQQFTSFFTTGYKLRGQAIRKFQPQYVQIYSRMNGEQNAYMLQGLWNYANTNVSNKWSTRQTVYNIDTRYDVIMRRHKIRGRGYAVQFNITSIPGQPFDIQGWAVIDTINQGA